MRRNFILFVLVALAIAAMLAFWGCSEDEELVLTTITISPSIATIAVDQEMEFTAKGYDQHGDEMSGITFSWTSSDTTITTITSDGLATGHQVGITSISAASEGVSGSAELTVVSTPIYSIVVSPSSVVVEEGETQQFIAVAKDSLGNDIPDSIAFTWESCDTDIATVDENGLATGISPGTTCITASTGEITGSASMQVYRPPIARIAFVTSCSGRGDIFLMEDDGSGLTQLTDGTADYIEPAWHPLCNKIAFSSDRDGAYRIWIMNVDGTDLEKISFGPGADKHPCYSADGTQIVFSSDRTGNNELFIMDADGSNVTQITDDIHSDMEPYWRGMGDKIVFSSDRSGVKNVWLYNLADSSKTQLTFVTDDRFSKDHPSLSPDGTLIVYRNIGYSTLIEIHYSEFHIMNLDGSMDYTIGKQAVGEFLVGPIDACFSPDGNRVVMSHVDADNMGTDRGIYYTYSYENNYQFLIYNTPSCSDQMVAW